jgi:hypothetical protein
MDWRAPWEWGQVACRLCRARGLGDGEESQAAKLGPPRWAAGDLSRICSKSIPIAKPRPPRPCIRGQAASALC